MHEFVFQADDESATQRLGAALAQTLPPGTTVALIGTLGAGKTRLVQALATAYGVPPETVVSPTFVLCHEYHGQRALYHLDAYRLKDDDEFLQLGPEEYFESEGITLIEWADRVLNCLPPQRLEVHIDVVGQTARQFRLVVVGEEASRLLDDLVAALGRGAEMD
jgi:tRNA threonylcarbamoyladenosine biosynthesis protein TsaE